MESRGKRNEPNYTKTRKTDGHEARDVATIRIRRPKVYAVAATTGAAGAAIGSSVLISSALVAVGSTVEAAATASAAAGVSVTGLASTSPIGSVATGAASCAEISQD